MIIPPAYTSYLKRNNGRGYWKLTKKHEPDLSLFPHIISNVVELLPRFKVNKKKYEPKNYDSEVSAENDTDDDSEVSPESEDSEHVLCCAAIQT